MSFVWVMLVAYALALFSDAPDKFSRPAIPAWVAWIFDLTIFAFFVWGGWYVTSLAYALSCIALEVIYLRRTPVGSKAK